MAAWRKVLVMGLLVLICVVPVLAQQANPGTDPLHQATVPLPQGQELSDEELIHADGEAEPLTIIAGVIVYAGYGAATTLLAQGVEIALGRRSRIDWEGVGIGAGIGAVFGPVGAKAYPGSVKVVRSAIVTGARWVARAGAAVASATISLAHRFHRGLHAVHVTLHRYVTEPVRNFFRRTWDWIRRRF